MSDRNQDNGSRYDFFLAHASSDKPYARALSQALRERGFRVFLDEVSLAAGRPGRAWVSSIPEAQIAAQATVVLVSDKIDRAWYLKEEIVQAIELSRRGAHDVIPVYIDGLPRQMTDVPYGLKALQGLDGRKGVGGVTDALTRCVGSDVSPVHREAEAEVERAPRAQEITEAGFRDALHRLTGRRLASLKVEVRATGFRVFLRGDAREIAAVLDALEDRGVEARRFIVDQQVVEVRVFEGDLNATMRFDAEKHRGSSASVPVAALSEAIRWVHVSDLRFGGPGSAERGVWLEALRLDAAEWARVHGSPNFVFVTGDVVNSGQFTEYDQAALWLAAFAKAVGVSVRDVFIVPGEHDVDRGCVARSVKIRDLHDAVRRDPHEKIDEYLAEGQAGWLWPKFEAFAEFAKKFGTFAMDESGLFGSAERQLSLGSVSIGGLNTALVSADEEDSARTLGLGARQINEVINKSSVRHVLFALHHHGPTWLSDGEALDRRLAARAHIALCSHQHTVSGERAEACSVSQVVRLRPGAPGVTASECGSQAYAWGSLDANGLHFFPRRWSKARGEFVEDAMHYPLRSGGLHHERDQLPEALATWLPRIETLDSITPAEPERIATVYDIFASVIDLDRTAQWARLVKSCDGSRHALVAAFGHYRQSVALFVHRVRRFAPKHSAYPHEVCDVLFHGAHDQMGPMTAGEWTAKMVRALGGGGTARDVLLDRLARSPLLMVFGPIRVDRMREEQWAALRRFLTEELPQMVAPPQEPNLLRVLVALDHKDSPVATRRTAEIRRWDDILDRGTWDFAWLPVLCFPKWEEEVEPYLWDRLRGNPRRDEVLNQCRKAFDLLEKTPLATFQTFVEYLDREIVIESE